jgi:hypothetical protein
MAEAGKKRYKKCREREVELGVIPSETGEFRGPPSDVKFAPPRRGCGSFHVEQLLARATPGKSQWVFVNDEAPEESDEWQKTMS